MKFIIFSTPRSRSFWLAKVLNQGVPEDSVGGVKHDPLGEADAVTSLPPLYGMVDTGAVFFAEELKLIYPKAGRIIVKRPLEDIQKSVEKLGWDGSLNPIACRELSRLESEVDLVIPYHKLNEYGRVLWQLCDLEQPYPEEYWTRMTKINLQIEGSPRPGPLLPEVRRKWLG